MIVPLKGIELGMKSMAGDSVLYDLDLDIPRAYFL